MRASRLFGSLIALVACEGAEGPPPVGFACRCEALTDTDLPTRVEVEVCARARVEAEAAALGRASAVGRVAAQRCACDEGGRGCERPR